MITSITNLVCEKLVAIDKKLNYLQGILLLGLLTVQIILKITILWKKVFVKMLQNSQGNICVGVSFLLMVCDLQL